MVKKEKDKIDELYKLFVRNYIIECKAQLDYILHSVSVSQESFYEWSEEDCIDAVDNLRSMVKDDIICLCIKYSDQ